MLAHSADQQVQVYDHTGAWVVALSLDLVRSLAGMSTSRVWDTGAFATAVRGLLHRQVTAMRKRLPYALFASYCQLPHALIEAFCPIFGLQLEWLASPLQRCRHVPHYASDSPNDMQFGSIGNAYEIKWVGSGMARAGLDLTSINAPFK